MFFQPGLRSVSAFARALRAAKASPSSETAMPATCLTDARTSPLTPAQTAFQALLISVKSALNTVSANI